MNDRELLEMAAKAAGYTLKDYYDVNGRWWPWCHELKNYWHPLTDDGDALRLAVKLRMDVRIYGTDVRVFCGGVVAFEGPPDFYAATRRAIVRAAAEIGRGMK